LRADERSKQDFGSLDAATGYARSLDTPAAVIEEGGRYTVYRILAERGIVERLFFRGDFSRDNAAVDGKLDATNVRPVHPGLRALVTTDHYVIRTKAAGIGTLDRIGSPLGPFSSHVQAFGPGLERITGRGAFERQFEQAMRDTAFQALDDSRRAVEDVRVRLNGQDLRPEDRANLDRSLKQLAPLDRQIADKQREVDRTYRDFLATGYPLARSEGAKQQQRAIEDQLRAYQALRLRRAELAQLNAQRAVAARDFPLVLRIENLDRFRGTSPQAQTAALRGAADQVLRDIATTRWNIENGNFNLWMMDGVRDTTAAGLGVTAERLRWIQDRAGTERRIDAGWKIGEGVVMIGLAVGGAFVSGGASLALLGAGAALGVHSAAGVTSDYFQNRAAANTNLDPNAGLIPQDVVGHWAFVAAAWIGVGLDAALVGGVARALSTGHQSIAAAAKTLGVSEDALRATIRAARVNDFRASVMEGEAFHARFGPNAADAVTVLQLNGRGGMTAEIVTRGGIGPQAQAAAVREEMVHLHQLADPALASHFSRLSEQSLARWSQMSATERMQTLRSQLTLEADAQRRILQQQGRQATPTEQIALEGYERRLHEVEQGLRDGQAPAWVANAGPPRLFSTPQWPATNAAAQAAGYPPAPAGQFYRRSTNGRDYELIRFDERSERWVNPDTNPAQRVVRNGGRLELAPAERQMTTAERQAEFEARYSGPTNNAALESAFDARRSTPLTPYQCAYARHYAPVFAELEKHGIAPSAILNRVAGGSEAASGQAIRDNLRAAMLDVINKAQPNQRPGLLQRFLKVQPSNGDRGELFTQFRAGNLPRDVKKVDLEPRGTTLAKSSRRADGAIEIENPPTSKIKPGRYLAEDKAGPGAFHPDQAKRYSEAFDGEGQITAANEQKYQGIVYFFLNRRDAEAALNQMRGLHPNIHVAYYNEQGTVGWLR